MEPIHASSWVSTKSGQDQHLSADDTIVLFDTGTGYKYVENMEPLW
jgi:hypothetical protein